ncbi:MAG: hypothetical protein ACXVAX_11590 [Pseudobdellovibrio sp.]
MNFKTWKEQKKVKDGDLVFASALKGTQQQEVFNKLADDMAALAPSFTEGLAFLETAVDLILMGHLETLFEKNKNFEIWNMHLKDLRYPQTKLRDETLKQRFEKLPWPYGSKVKFERRGDKFGAELKLFISNPSDLTKILASLERVKQELEL